MMTWQGWHIGFIHYFTHIFKLYQSAKFSLIWAKFNPVLKHQTVPSGCQRCGRTNRRPKPNLWCVDWASVFGGLALSLIPLSTNALLQVLIILVASYSSNIVMLLWGDVSNSSCSQPTNIQDVSQTNDIFYVIICLKAQSGLYQPAQRLFVLQYISPFP